MFYVHAKIKFKIDLFLT
uniref:Uncharacterized protein n=1 Tax=Arundo donax TaxID=35708 RepID=A0A0A9B342_ARUDO